MTSSQLLNVVSYRSRSLKRSSQFSRLSHMDLEGIICAFGKNIETVFSPRIGRIAVCTSTQIKSDGTMPKLGRWCKLSVEYKAFLFFFFYKGFLCCNILLRRHFASNFNSFCLHKRFSCDSVHGTRLLCATGGVDLEVVIKKKSQVAVTSNFFLI